MGEKTTKLHVCHSSMCRRKGAPLLLRDLEELCAGYAIVEPGSCLRHCQSGPNVQIVKGRRKKTIIGAWLQNWILFPKLPGVEKFADVDRLVVENVAGAVGSSAKRIVTRLKYEIRREKSRGIRQEKLAKGFSLVQNNKREARLLAELLVLRSHEWLQLTPHVEANKVAAAHISPDPVSALADARNAVELVSDWAQAHLALADALEANGNLGEAADAAKTACNLCTVPERTTVIGKFLAIVGQMPAHERGRYCPNQAQANDESDEENDDDYGDNHDEDDDLPARDDFCDGGCSSGKRGNVDSRRPDVTGRIEGYTARLGVDAPRSKPTRIVSL